MINIIPAQARYHAEHGWLSTYHHFSFGEYDDPANMNFGPLRVFNDDTIQGGGGFGAHPHRNMEIVTVILDGQLEHKDNMGHKEVIHDNEVQVMSAGRGVVHSEYNPSPTNPARLTQLWLLPRKINARPRYDQKAFEASRRINALLPIVSDGRIAGTLTIDQDAAIYVATLEPGHGVRHDLKTDRLGYLFVAEGQIAVNGQSLNSGDQARVSEEPSLDIQSTGETPSRLIFLDLPELQLS